MLWARRSRSCWLTVASWSWTGHAASRAWLRHTVPDCIDGLYAAGDVANGLAQISHAMGAAGVAATTIRDELAKQRSLFR